jgi:aspartate/methionine/tyrosine aminotransferase
MKFWPLRPQNGWLPDLADVQTAICEIDETPDEYLALVVVNAQHNPTGRSWPVSILRGLFEAATSRRAAILLDDPYYFVVTDDIAPVSAPQVLLEHFANKQVPESVKRSWCRVQSFGKAFMCNHWGIGSVMAHPETLRSLAKYTFEWAFPREGTRQWAMAHWLADPACDEYLAQQRAVLRRKRTMWADALRDFGWPAQLTPVGEATPYFLVALPPKYLTRSNAMTSWRQDILNSTGILFSYASIEQEGTEADVPFLRAYLGGDESVVFEAIRRFQNTGIRYVE